MSLRRIARRLLTGLALLAAVALSLSAEKAQATILDFEIGNLGSIDFLGGDADLLTGSSLSATAVTGIAGTILDGVSTSITGACGTFGCLDFTTGTLLSYDGSTWTFGGGGTLTIVGDVTMGGDVTLLTTTVTGATVLSFGGGFKISIVTTTLGIIDATTLATLYGVATSGYDGVGAFIYSGVASLGTAATCGGFLATCQLLSSSISSGDYSISVPEPSTLGLLGFALAGLGFMTRRRRRARGLEP